MIELSRFLFILHYYQTFKQKMSSKQLLKQYTNLEQQQQLKVIKDIRSLKDIPKRLNTLFTQLQEIYRTSNAEGQTETKQINNKVNVETQYQSFCEVFSRLSKNQQSLFLNQIMEEIRNRQNNIKKITSNSTALQFKCKIRVTSFCVQQWKEAVLKINKDTKIIKIQNDKRSFNIYLREYMIRKSKVHQLCFVLQNVGFAAKQKSYTYHIKFVEQQRKEYFLLQKQLKNLIFQAFSQEILKEINQHRVSKIALKRTSEPIRIFLTSQNLFKLAQSTNKFNLNSKESQLSISDQNNLKTSSLDLSVSAVQLIHSNKFKIHSFQKDQSVYLSQYQINMASYPFFDNFLMAYKNCHATLFQMSILQQISQEIDGKTIPSTSAFYQKIIWKQKIYGQIFICKQQKIEKNLLLENNSDFGIIFLMKDIDHDDNASIIDLMQISARRTEENKIKITILAKFYKEVFYDEELILEYLSRFIDVFQNKQIQERSRVCNNVHRQMVNATVSHGQGKISLQNQQKNGQKEKNQKLAREASENKQIQHLFSDNLANGERKSEPLKVTISKQYLKHKFEMNFSRQKRGKIMKQHFLWNNWRRAQNGGLICRNEELVQRQKKMYKIVIKKFGQTLLMGKNIINFSLPVIIFKKQSHLQSLAKSYLYSPIFTEKAASISDPLQRMKFSVILMITQNAMSIHMQKPFNPILGETYQGYINGCPIYLQQISHHPPISAYYLIGRGYKKYGSIEPRISIGLNNGSGYSINPHYVQFDDGMKIQYVCAKIMIGGLLVGERTFNFEDKIYAYDRKHRYFASVNFGPVKRGFFSSSSQPDDYFHGHIYQVTPEFQQLFNKTEGFKPHPEEGHIVKKLIFFDGIWNSSININGEQVLNFKTDLPYQFQQQPICLPSDSKYRQDLCNLLAGDLEAAQIAKQQMEQSQRYDRKLRQRNKN